MQNSNIGFPGPGKYDYNENFVKFQRDSNNNVKVHFIEFRHANI